VNYRNIFWQATRASIVTAAAFSIQGPAAIPKAAACDGCKSTTACGAPNPGSASCAIISGECFNSQRNCSI
jgi:hypothetical protein